MVIVKDGKILATGFRGESGKGDHGEYCALKKVNEADVQGATVYTTLEPCSERNPPKKSCTERLITSTIDLWNSEDIAVYKIIYTAVDEKPEVQFKYLMSDLRHR